MTRIEYEKKIALLLLEKKRLKEWCVTVMLTGYLEDDKSGRRRLYHFDTREGAEAEIESICKESEDKDDT